MNTKNLTKTNIIDFAKAELIEKELAIELNNVYNYINKIDNKYQLINPDDNDYNISRKFTKGMKSFAKLNRETMQIELSYRAKWKRQFETIILQGEKVGYKLPTTKLSEGYILGNFKLIN